jgi:hypothetical protein
MSNWIPEKIEKMKRFLSILCIAIVTVGFATTSKASVPSVGDSGKAWSIPNNDQLGQHIQQFLDTSAGEVVSELLPSGGYQGYNDEDPTCSSLLDPKCISRNVDFQAVVPFCKDSEDVDCTAEMGVIDSSGKKIRANFSRYFPAKSMNQYVGSPLNKLPSGGPGSLFAIPEAPHDGGDKYYLSVVMRGNGSVGRGMGLSDFSVRLYPVNLQSEVSTNSFGDSGWGKIPAGQAGNPTGKDTWARYGPGFSGSNFCVATSGSESLCAQRYAFPSGFQFYVSIRTQNLPAGWLHGRLASPDIKITKASSFSTIEIQAEPVAVPAVYKMYRYPEMPEAIKSQYDLKTGSYKNDPYFIRNPNAGLGGRTAENENPLLRNVISSPEASSAAGMEQLRLWLPFVEDKATALLSYWSVRTLSQEEMQGSDECFKDTGNVTGIVTTNSTQYSAGPPKFNKSEGTLDYQVAAPHYAPDKTDFKGSYDLVMRSDVARCIYGFSKSPINATLSITSSDGTPQVATTVIGERNGWLYLQAKNFEFSSPIIKAKLSQEAEVAVVAPAVPAKVSVKKTTITCSKGKLSKKISGVKPRCPAGFKKK